MAGIQLAAGVLDDFDRFPDHLARFEGPDGPAPITGLLAAIDILRHSPLIGRPVRAIRSQREEGYKRSSAQRG